MNRKVLLIVMLALLAGLGTRLATLNRPMPGPPEDVLWPEPRPVPELALTDHRGAAFDRGRLEGQWSLLFFGFTHCPDICPMTLAVLDQITGKLAGGGMRAPQTVFVSVDPERDTPERLADYVGHFNADFIGVSGPKQELDRLTQALSAVYMIASPDEQGAYSVDHTAALFLLDPRARLVSIFTAPHEAADLAQRITAVRRFVDQQLFWGE